MGSKIVEEFIKLHQEGSLDKVWENFSLLSADERKQVLAKLLDVVASPRNTNRAIVMPNAASVIKRKLKTGVEFDKWYQGWLPPVEPQNLGNVVVRDYFPIPTRVINLRPVDGEDSFLTIGFLYSPYATIEELLNARPKEVQETESKRRNVNEDLLADSEVTFYSVASDDIFGL